MGMPTMSGELSPDDADFLGRVSAAVFHNPFSQARQAVDLELADADASMPRAELLSRVVDRVQARLVDIAGAESLDVRRFRGEARKRVEHAVLFLLFHRYADPLDAFIEAQVAGQGTGQGLPFTAALMDELTAYGFRKDAAAHMVAVFFQMRRAFYFIDRSLVGRAPCMRSLREQLWNNVCTADIGRYSSLLTERMEDFSTILLGPTGSGKGAAAAAIGRSGFIPYDPSRQRFVDAFTSAFIPINLSAYPATLIESELFGHRKGAFTGAIDGYDGVLGRCSPHGAVFLDEIGEVSIPVQIKLLRVLQERNFTPVGSHTELPFRGRVIAATHQDLTVMRREGTFRDDFYYRLCSDVIEVPPLRLRLAEDAGELELLLEHLLARILGGEDSGLVDEVATKLRRGVRGDYPWPGNVRELEQATRRILMGNAFTGEAGASSADDRHALVQGVDAGSLTAKGLVSLYCRTLHARHGTYEEVARRVELDRRTVKKHIVDDG
ncbi:MAG: sigma 54-interacting transcriptional regulator [Nannocystaceae bacterium]|nr:sigma 54-interacting transcriptional regulator [Nannocystaceae bacterium]